MCGRYTLTAPIEEILEHYSISGDGTALPSCYNIAPSKDVHLMDWGNPYKVYLWQFILPWMRKVINDRVSLSVREG
jgi:putative SOS response-associated peptidase YedK